MLLIKQFVQSLFTAFGAVWLILQAYYNLANIPTDHRISFTGFLLIGIVLGCAWFLIDGFYLAGYLKSHLK